METRHALPPSLLLFLALMNAPLTAQESAPPQGTLRTDRPTTIDEFLKLGQRPRVIAHRGFSGQAPENTLAAVRKAIEIGADMVEIDVLLSRDRRVVVLHDDTLDRTTDGRGSAAEADFAALRELDAGSWFSEEFAGERIPALEEVLDLVRGHILLNVEIKGEAVRPDDIEGGIVDQVLRMIGERQMGGQVILSSFEPEALRQARRLDAEIRTASLYNRELHRGLGPLAIMDAVGSRGFNLNARLLTPEILSECHGEGRPVAVYTVNKPEDLRRAIAAGVNAIFTDHPDRMLAILAEVD